MVTRTTRRIITRDRAFSTLTAMSVATPTVLPRSPLFPNLLPRPPQPHPTPLSKHGQRSGRLNSLRDLQREMDDLSDEEEELEDLVRRSLHHRISQDSDESFRTRKSGTGASTSLCLSVGHSRSMRRRTTRVYVRHLLITLFDCFTAEQG